MLANGEWRDFEIVLTGKGKPGKPITLISEEPGKVFITGKSNLKIGGSHILVTGLIFRNGYSPTGEVIAFRRSKEEVATDSRVTEVVIDRFNQPDRAKTDYWVALDGKRNRFDHNHLVGKSNDGVTLAVRLDLENSRENGHRIDHNYFGPRPVLGSNGGETIRIGTSTYSMFDSRTIVEDNIFDRCDGEIEIISIKSGANIVRRNLFLESRGAVTLRHGDGNLVERNIFKGNGKDHTGGIRVINRNQTVRGNYMEALGGTGFAGALTVMNGVPNSPVNRYVQVSNALIEQNSIISSARVTLAAGSDAERSARPINSRFERNLLIFDNAEKPVVLEDDVSGIAFAGNVVVGRTAAPALAGGKQGTIATARDENGLLYPVDAAIRAIGAPRDLKVLMLDQVGVKFYPKPASGEMFGHGKTIEVAPGHETLSMAFTSAANGDILQLADGNYVVDRTLLVDKTVTVQGSGAAHPKIRFSRTSLFEIADSGNLRLHRVDIGGDDAPDVVGNSVIRTSASPILANFVIQLDDVRVSNLMVNKAFDVMAFGKGSMADRVEITDSRFENITGKIVAADAETDDFGRYNAEYLTVRNSTFGNVWGSIVSLYRGGTDESTFGPHFVFEGNVVAGSGTRPLIGDKASISLLGVQHALIRDNAFTASAPIKVVQTTGVPNSRILDNIFKATPRPLLSETQAEGPPRVTMSGNSFDGLPQ